MTRARTSELPPPAAHPPDAWLRLSEAATYVRMTESGLRSVIHRGEIKPDGAGPRRTHMFRASTLDAFLEGRVRCYSGDRYATAGSLEPGLGNDQQESRPGTRA
jgi:hypothetical protein